MLGVAFVLWFIYVVFGIGYYILDWMFFCVCVDGIVVRRCYSNGVYGVGIKEVIWVVVLVLAGIFCFLDVFVCSVYVKV